MARGTYQICQSGQHSLSAATVWSAVLPSKASHLLTSLQVVVVRPWLGCSRTWLGGKGCSLRPAHGSHRHVAVELSPDAFAGGGLADSPLVGQGLDEYEAES